MQRKLCTRKIDELGRIVLPQEARTALGTKTGQSLDIFIEGDSIVIKNTGEPTCALCGESDATLTEVAHNHLCGDCISSIKAV
ncbi:MAG: AbrB/MazE/SpoVT family DNA-binding domain-containing protein [Firmicutes bacterium]|nr:AbrB/MazE/SpoVT family DNA-binding domain-containing protein [Bacillota bacterium]